MTNRELIEKLKEFPLDAEVEFDVETYDSEYRDTYSCIGNITCCDSLGIVNIELDNGM